MLQTTISDEFEMLVTQGLLTEKEADAANHCAHEASFVTSQTYRALGAG